jgi:hypothetical protein
MMRRLALPYATIGWLAAVVGAVGGVALRIVDPVPIIPDELGAGELAQLGFDVLGVTFASVGAVLVVRRPANAVGWCMVLIGASNALAGLTSAIAFSAFADGPAGAATAGIAAWLTNLFIFLGSIVLPLGFIFPTGRGHTPSWDRFVRAGALALLAMLVVFVLIRPGPLQIFAAIDNPFGFGPDVRTVLGAPISTLIVGSVAFLFPVLVLSLVSRYRMSDRIGRQQLKWFILALVLTLCGMTAAVAGALIGDEPPAAGMVVFGFAGAFIPVAIGIAILRYNLYDIDRLISRSLGYAVVTGVLAVVFAATAIVLSAVLGSLAQGESLAVAGSTLFVVALFGPLRRRAQAAIDRRFDRARYDASLTLHAMTVRLRDDVDLERVEADVLGVVHRTFHPTSSALWLRARTATSPR